MSNFQETINPGHEEEYQLPDAQCSGNKTENIQIQGVKRSRETTQLFLFGLAILLLLFILNCLELAGLYSLSVKSVKFECERNKVQPKNTTKLFFLSREQATYFDAFKNCKINEMELVAIENEEEAKSLYKYLEVHGHEKDNFWSSGIDLQGNRKYYWLQSGKLLNYSIWYPGEPNNSGVLCLLLVPYNSNITLVDHPCTDSFKYVCEYTSKA